MIMIDNSEFTRNGDYMPTRFDAQLDSVDYIFQSKIHSNPENTCGLLSLGGDGPKVLSSLTADFGRILKGIHETKIEGELHLSTSIQVATLVLKHRQNTHQLQRVIAFVSSPVLETEQELVKLAKKLKKNSVSVDIINFGEELQNTAKLEKFIETVNKDDSSHLLTVPPGPKLLYEHVASSAILNAEGEASAFGAGVGGDDFFDMGADPNMDPELLLLLRLSLEEERARQEREQQQQQDVNVEPIPEEKDEKDESMDESK